jgi:hypothetical protein
VNLPGCIAPKSQPGRLGKDRVEPFEAASESVGVPEGQQHAPRIGLMLDTIATYDRFIE